MFTVFTIGMSVSQCTVQRSVTSVEHTAW